MRSDLVVAASKIIPEPPVLMNLVSARVKQLNNGRSPLVKVDHRMGAADIALTEIIEGKIGPIGGTLVDRHDPINTEALTPLRLTIDCGSAPDEFIADLLSDISILSYLRENLGGIEFRLDGVHILELA